MKVDVKDAIAALSKYSSAGQKQIGFASRVAMTRSAQAAGKAEEREIRDIFDAPTPFTMTSVFVRPATAANPTAEVKLKDFAGKGIPAAAFLAAQIRGGERKQKRFERALQAVGAMPSGYRAVPGSAAKLDAHGNMDRGQIVQILSYFRAFPEVGYKANMTDKKREALARGSKARQGYAYFVGRPGDRLPLGIYQRVMFARGSALKPVMIFVQSATYQALFDFKYVAETTVQEVFASEFQRALAEAMRSAR